MPPISPSTSRAWPRSLLVVLAAGAVARVLLWMWFASVVPRIQDETEYIQIAEVLVDHGEFGHGPDRPTSIRPPLYPAFVAGIFWVAGDDSLQAVRLAQAAISLLTTVVVFRLGRMVYSERAGVWAAGLFCFYPTFLGFNNLILTEVMFTLWLMAGVLALVSGMRRQSFATLAGAGVLLALGALTRSILYPFAPFLALFLAAAWQGSVGRRALAALAFIVPFVVVLTPWAIRNTQLHGTFVPVDCMGGRNFMMGNYEYTPFYRSWDAISTEGDRSWIGVLNSRRPESHEMTQGQLDKLALKEGIEFVKANPGLTAERDVVKFFDFWGLERELIAGADQGYFGSLPRAVVLLLGLLICGVYVAVLFTGAFGAALYPPADRRAHYLFLLLVAMMCGVHMVIFAHSRYHLPAMPFVILYAAGAITGTGVWVRRKTVGFWAAALFCTVVVAGWTWGAAAGDLSKLARAAGLTA